MASQPLTVIVKIKLGEEENLKQILREINANLADNPFLSLGRSRLTHFARLAIISDSENGQRLLFVSNFDGSLENYLEELLSLGDSEQIWNKCEGYRGRATFSGFIEEHAQKAQAVFKAFPRETVTSIRQKKAIRQNLETFIDLQDVAQFLDSPGINPLIESLSVVPHQVPWWRRLGIGFSQLFEALGNSLTQTLNSLRESILQLLFFIGEILGAPDNPEKQIGEYTGVRVDNQRLRELYSSETVNGINHLHLVSTVKRGRLLRLKIVLFLVNFSARNLFPLGVLASIPSIHFAHWSIIDQGKHLVFVTHYDGSFDNYLGDFSNNASVLNSIWNNVEGYPQAGAADLVAFKQFFRNDQQPPSLVFYPAYPEVTVKNILRDLRIVDPLATNFNREATQNWLENL